jgi:hypothetical protein
MLEGGDAAGSPGRRLAVLGLCAAMAALLALAIAIPAARRFYLLSVPDGDMLAAWAAGSAIAVGLAWIGVRLTGAMRSESREPAAAAAPLG